MIQFKKPEGIDEKKNDFLKEDAHRIFFYIFSKGFIMLVISPEEALSGRGYAIVTIEDDPRIVYDLYTSEEIAQRICDDLNIRYGETIEDPITGKAKFKNVYDVARISR